MSSPYTQIAYAANGWTNNRPNFDRSLFAVFNGGRLMGGNYDSESCVRNTLGYGTIGYHPFIQAHCAGASNEITADFSQPVKGKRIELRGKYPQSLTITESGRRPFTIDFYPVYRDGALVGGAAMPGLDAPARRVGFFYAASSQPLTYEGSLLFDNAVRWAAGL